MSTDCSVAAIVVKNGLFLVARRGDCGGALSGLWEFPGGKLEEGETEGQGLIREFDEEFGARLVPIRAVAETSFTNKGRERRLVAWLAELPEGEKLELREHVAVSWLEFAALPGIELADSDRKLLPALVSLVPIR